MADAPNEKRLIELEPLGVTPTSEPPVRIPSWIERRRRKVPNRPGFRCPACDYDVRGLTSLTCPECGCEFTVTEAHLAGLPYDPLSAEDCQAMRRDRLTIGGCAVVFILAFFSPYLLSWTPPTGTGLFGHLIFAGFFVGVGAYYFLVGGRPLAQAARSATVYYVGFMIVVNVVFG